MSKKKNKKKNIQKKVAKDDRFEVLKQMLACGGCGDAGQYVEHEFRNPTERVEYCVENLPAYGKAEEQFVNYLFSDGMGAGGVTEDAKLDAFRFRNNAQNATNNSILRTAIKYAHCRYGECGVRWKDGDVYLYKSGTYAPLTIKVDGIDEVLGYIATKNGDLIAENSIDLQDILKSKTMAEIEDTFDSQGYILMDKSEFVNLRNDTSQLHGVPPLEKDKLRIDLLISVYERLNYDVDFDGPGRLLFLIENGYLGDENNEVSTSKILQTAKNQRSAAKQGLKEVERIATDIKDSSSDAVIAASKALGQPIHLPRTTKATEFLEWLQEKEGKIIADIIGLPPSLLEEGHLSGNVSMTRIIDNAVLSAIVSYREHYMSQLSPLLSSHLDLAKVYFNKYELQSEESQTAKWSKLSSSIYQLAMAYEKAPSEEVMAVINTFAEMLTYDTHDSVGGIVELAEKKDGGKQSWLKRTIFGKF